MVHSKEGFVDFHLEEMSDDDADDNNAVELDILEEMCHYPISNPRCFSVDVGEWGNDHDNDGEEEGSNTVRENPMLESIQRVFHHFAENEIPWKTLDLHSVNDHAVHSIGSIVETASRLNLFREMELSLVSFANDIDGILSGIEQNQRLELLEIHIQGDAFSESDGFSLERLLTTTQKLRTLRICGVTNLRLESLCRGIAANTTLNALSIDLSSADDDSLNMLFSTLAMHPSLQFLEMTTSNSCYRESFAKGLNVLLSFSSSLEHLSLSNFHRNGMLALEELSDGLKQSRSLKVIETYSALCGETNLSTIFRLLPECPTLERLYFYEQCIDKQDLEKIKGMKRLDKPVILFLSARIINYLSKTIEEVLRCHPEIQLIAHDLGEVGKSLKHLCDLHLHGRYLLDRRSVPLSLWPLVLQKCATKENVLYFFLKGPAFAAR